MKHLIVLMAIAILASCYMPPVNTAATKATASNLNQNKPQVKASGFYVFKPYKAEGGEATTGSFLDESGETRWVPQQLGSVKGVMVMPQPKPAKDEKQ